MHMNWLPEGTFDRGVVRGLLVGMAWFILVSLYRSAVTIAQFGLWRWLTSAFRIEHGSLGMILLLLVLLLVTVLCFPPVRWS
jgi:hypothetical protein